MRASIHKALLTAALSVFVAVGGVHAAEAGHRARMAGSGSITVIFENGLGDSLDVWRHVAPDVAACARTFTYDRAGYLGSGSARGVRDAEAIVSELRAELAARGVSPPYLLVGHSLGGLYLQYFERRYPEEVAGLVLVDSTHWDQMERIRVESVGTWRTLRALSVLMRPIMRRELKDSETAGAQVSALPASIVPTIVLSSTSAAPGETAVFRGLHRRLQLEIAAGHRTVRHDFVEGSGHYIQRERPDAVVRAIKELAQCQ